MQTLALQIAETGYFTFEKCVLPRELASACVKAGQSEALLDPVEGGVPGASSQFAAHPEAHYLFLSGEKRRASNTEWRSARSAIVRHSAAASSRSRFASGSFA